MGYALWMRALVILSLALAGCTYPEFEFDPLDANADDTSPVADVAADSVADVAEDASFDTGSLDATLDTSPDTAIAPEVGADTKVVDVGKDTAPLSGCAAITADFCADFDSVVTPAAGWTNTEITAGGSLAIDASGRSLPNSLLAVAPTSGTSTLVTAYLHKQLTSPAPTTPMRLEAWIKLDASSLVTTTGSAFLLKIERTGSAGDGVTLSIDNTGLFAERIGTTYERYPISFLATPGAWMRVRLDATLHTTNGALTIWINDMTTPVVNKTGITTAQGDVTARSVLVGLFVQRATGAFRARYDDVSFSFK